MTSHDDPIVAEVRAVRERLAAKHGNTVEGIFRHLREVQRLSGRTYVRYPANRIEPQTSEIRTSTEDAKR
ncbi:MAG: hypothetical protein OXF79_26165 [Chloroflexi bacterium]|nr:hypothetical protein [Chloroflexota bacterium]